MTKEDLKDTYLKYSEDITEEVWNKIIDKLESLGIFKYEGGRDNDYKGFIRHGMLRTGIDNNHFIWQTARDNLNNIKQIQVSNILGSDWDIDKKEDIKFEVGKWYYYEHGKNTTNSMYYLKFTKLINNKFHYSEFIHIIDKYHKFQKADLSIKYMYNTRIASLEEIQQYLPDGHEDKIVKEKELTINDLVEGEIYSTTFPSQGTYVFINSSPCPWIQLKYPDNKESERFGIDEYNTEFIPNNGFNKFNKANFQEKKQLLCSIQQNKFIPKEELDKYDDEGNLIQKNEFKKGDYIVFFESTRWSDSFPKNFIFKQRENSSYLKPEVDAIGSTSNGWEYYRNFDKNLENNPEYKTDWRYGTQEEINEYNRLGKPFDVTTLQNKKEEYPEYVETVNWAGKFCKNGEIYKVLNGKVKTPHTNFNVYYNANRKYFKPSTKEAYEAQFNKVRNVMKPFPTSVPYYKLKCINETTHWTNGINEIKEDFKFYPGDITWEVIDKYSPWEGTSKASVCVEYNKNSINYRQSDFEVLEIINPTNNTIIETTSNDSISIDIFESNIKKDDEIKIELYRMPKKKENKFIDVSISKVDALKQTIKQNKFINIKI